MKLDLEDLYKRHDFWRQEIGTRGIWKPGLFLPVTIEIRKESRRMNALFSRRIIRKGAEIRYIDKIIIYRNGVEDFNEHYLDSVLVHEMVHQYITQNKIKDSGSHGRIFRMLMNLINSEFKERLNIKIRGHNPDIPVKGPGEKVHRLLLIDTEKDFYCCVVNPNKQDELEKLVKKNLRRWKIRNYRWGESNDNYFNNYVRCTSSIHGKRIDPTSKSYFYQIYSIREI